VRRLATRILAFLKIDASVGIALVGNQTMKKNVLAWRAIHGFPRPDIAGKFLGDIQLNPLYIKEHGESLDYMLIHGILHLAGYDHVKTRDRIRMERKEKVIEKHITRS
jgi:ssRNA-specific RNase YbeY (16S rRNA maturation enzyme)